MDDKTQIYLEPLRNGDADMYATADSTEPLRCAGCDGRIGQWPFTFGDGVAYHFEHDPDVVTKRESRGRWARAWAEFNRLSGHPSP